MPLDDSLTYEITALNLQGGEYRKIFHLEFDGLCKHAYNETYRSYFENFQAKQDHTVKWKTCPYPAGPNRVNKFYIEDYGNLIPPYIPGNERWLIKNRFVKNGKPIGGSNAYGILRNEQSLLNG
jgi:hypothetical protein